MNHLSLRARAALMLLCLSILFALTGCMSSADPAAEPETPEETTEAPSAEVSPSQHVSIVNNLFTLRYDSKGSFNPIISGSADNLIIAQLMYESLFALDSSFETHPILADSWESEDNTVYRITIKPDIMMSDNSTLTASDVAYTLNMARERGRFVNRLTGIAEVSAEDSLTVVITLSSPNAHLTKLLDIPIIKSGSIDYRTPPGTGPYTLSGGESQYLTRHAGYRDYAKLPIQAIFLGECTNLELIEQFSDGLIDLLWDDPTDSVVFESSRQHDIRAYNTTTMLFAGFNVRMDALKIPEVRRAVGLAVDRQYITGTIMDGYALASPLAFSPAYSLYNSDWEHSGTDTFIEMTEILSSAGFADNNDDSYLEYFVPGVGYELFNIDFIVNSENSFKVSAARHIAEALRHTGIDITVRELEWADYTEALSTGDFDMYLGDVALGADFDLSPLLLPGGRLDYGGTGDALYEPYLNAYFSAGSTTSELIAAKQLCELIYQNAPFIPISYKKHAMHSYRGVVSGASPSQSTIFFGLTDWKIVPGTDVRALP